MLTLAGIPLSPSTPAFSRWVANNIPTERATQWLTRAWPGLGLQGIAWPTGFRIPDRIRLNRLVWPTGASRWAYGFFLGTTAQVEAIRKQAFGDDGEANETITLRMESPDDQGEASESITTDLYLLPPTPLAWVDPGIRVPSGEAAYLLTVVDQRFYWWAHAAPDFGINDTAGKTWQNVFDAIAAELDITIDVGTIDPAYLQPSRGLNLTYETIPPLLDACCASIGHRLVCGLDNGVSTQSFTEADQAADDDAADNPDRTLRAGQDRFLDDL